MFEEPLNAQPEKPQPSSHHPGALALGVIVIVVVAAYALALSGVLHSPHAVGTEEPFLLGVTEVPMEMPQAEVRPPAVDWKSVLEHTRGERAYAERMRAATLSVYDRRNAFGSGGLTEGREAVALYTVYAAAGDFYGEGLLQTAYLYAREACRKGSMDPLVMTICDAFARAGEPVPDAAEAQRRRAVIDGLLATNYPAVCKLGAVLAGLNTMFRLDQQVVPGALSDRSELADAAVAEVVAIAGTKPPERLLVTKASSVVDAIRGSRAELASVGPALEAELVKSGVPGGELAIFRASLLMAEAWALRGSVRQEQMSPEVAALTVKRFEEAERILIRAAGEFPKDAWVPTLLMQVVLAQGKGKERMDYWFAQAVAIDPKLRKPYSNRMSNIQPLWHGTQQEVLEFGQRCLETGYWEEKIPMVQVDGIMTLAAGAEPVYRDEALWETVRGTTREYLKRYPRSISYRTLLLRYAVRAGKWPEAREQMAALGEYWDRQVISDGQYEKLRGTVAEHP